MISNQPRTRLHSQLDQAGVSRDSKIKGREPLWIHPDDAAARGLKSGDIARVFNARGQVLAGVTVTDKVMPGVIQLATGAWFDPAQAGHGIFLEVLDGNQILAWWFTFTPDGQQAWFGNVGAIDPATNTATVDALQTQGGRWIPNFDPSTVTQPLWGRLTFSFTDCNHGRVDFDSGVAGYGEGHMDLTRLTQPTGLSCP